GVTLRERRRAGAAPAAPGVVALAAFGVLALATTVPLPPAVLQLLEPASARLYAGLLPGWPGAGGWSTWRAVAFDPYAVWVEPGRGIGVRGRRAWVAVLVVHQQRLWPPLVAAGAALLMTVAHLASGSRGGVAALLVGLAVAGAGILARQATRWRWAPAVLPLVLLVGGGASVGGWAMADGDGRERAATGPGAVSLATRLAVSAEGSGIVRDHPL